MLDVGRIGSRSDAYVKYRSIDQKIFMTMREAEVLSHDLATEILAVERPDLLVGIANGALLPTRIRGGRHRFCQLSRRSCTGPTPTCIWLVCRILYVRVKDAKELSLLPDVPRCALCVPPDRNAISRTLSHERWVWPVPQ